MARANQHAGDTACPPRPPHSLVSAPLVYIIAGEPSGDLLGARLMAALRRETDGQVRFAGIGGEQMAAEGLTSLFDLRDIAIMGFVEVLPRIPLVLKRVRETVADIARRRPAVLVTIDSWGFTGRVNAAVRGLALGTLQVHYVAPMVWAWRPQRARRMVGRIDHLMTLFPSEPPAFAAVGLPATCVGHPVIEGGAEQGDGEGFRQRHAIAADRRVVCLLPGSRRGEVGRLLPVFAEAAHRLAARSPNLHYVIPTVATVADTVTTAVGAWPVPVTVVHGSRDRVDAFAAAAAAAAASGTVVLELALAQVPTVVTYRVGAISAWLFRRMTSLRHVSLVNILLDRPVMPELLQEDCRADALADALGHLLDDGAARADQRAGAGEAMARLGHGGPSPSTQAARLVLDLMGRGDAPSAIDRRWP